jgi:hypothetical protein
MERFELQNHRKLGRLAKFVLDDVAGDFFRQREWESHCLLRLNGRVGRRNCGQSRVGNRDRRFGFQDAWHKKINRGDAFAHPDAAATRSQKSKSRAAHPQTIFGM